MICTKIGSYHRTIIIEIWSETPSNKQKYSSDEIEAAHNQIFMVIFEKTNHSRQNSMNGRQMCFYCCVRIFFIIALSKHNVLTDCPRVRQTKAKRAKSRNLMKLGWVNQLIGRIDHAKYFWPETTLMAVAAHPNFQFTNKN